MFLSLFELEQLARIRQAEVAEHVERQRMLRQVPQRERLSPVAGVARRVASMSAAVFTLWRTA